MCIRAGKYLVEPSGLVFNLDYRGTGKVVVLRHCVDRGGYLRVHLCHNGVQKKVMLHRVVAIAHLPQGEPGRVFVNHKDGLKGSCSAENLEWCTQSENELHAFSHGLKAPMHGEFSCAAKFSDQQVSEFLKAYDAGATVSAAAGMCGMSEGHAFKVLSGARRRSGPRSECYRKRTSKRVATGERHGNAKLTAATVLEIRERFRSGARCAELARAYGVSWTTVSRIVRGYRWKHVGDEQ